MIVVIIPDARSLISLARADRLDLLDRFNSQILITDAFKFEVLGGGCGVRIRKDSVAGCNRAIIGFG